MELLEIKKIATDFRNVLDFLNADGRLQKSSRPYYLNLKEFPSGACGDVTYLFVKYLYETKGVRAKSLFARLTHDSNHSWASIDNIYIDLTADQFNSAENTYEPVIVCSEREYPLRSQIYDIRENPGPFARSGNHSCYICTYNLIKETISLLSTNSHIPISPN